MRNKKIIMAVLLFILTALLTSCSFLQVDSIIDSVVESSNSLSAATVTLEETNYTYNGTAFEPAIVSVAMGTTPVTADNYTVTYADNINAGTATVTITAAGTVYKNSKTVDFTINSKPLGSVYALMTTSYTYTGNSVIPDISNIKSDGVALTTSDYDLSFANNIIVGANTASVTITGKGNYTGTAVFNYSITQLDLADVEIILSQTTFTHTGGALEPEILRINLDGNLIALDSEDYIISYSNNINIGTSATVTITGQNNCTGTANVYFTITDELYYFITFSSVEGEEFQTISEKAGADISKPADPVLADNENHTINWYTNTNYAIQNRFFFDTMPAQNYTLYGRWEEEKSMTFFAYENATPDTSIDSRQELLEYMEYIFFNQIVSADVQPDYYVLDYTYSTLATELQTVFDDTTYPATTGYGYSSITEGNTVSIKLYVASEGTNVFEPTIAATASDCEQLDSFNSISVIPERAANFDDFYIENLTESYEVTSSNQLYFLLEHGLKPNPVSGSSAQNIYNAAKVVLRTIINTDMTDYQKVQAIYQWMANEIVYDYNVGNIASGGQWINYNDFYLEGVFDDGIAVCDGISKAFVVLCQIEGIPCVRVTGDYTDTNNNVSGHAWNKVKVDGQWYVVDATWGNTSVYSNDNEFLNYQHFLISDATKASYGCNDDNFTNSGVAATGSDSYFENNTYDSTNDFVIESQAEFNELLQYCVDTGDYSDHTVNFIITFDYESDLDDELTIAWNSTFALGLSPGYIIASNEPQVITIVFN